MERGNVFLPRGNVPRDLEALPAAILLDAAPPGRLDRNGALRARAGSPVCEARKHFDRLCGHEPATRETGASRVFVIPAEVGWSDIGSWAAVYELLARHKGENVSAGAFKALDADGNFFWSPGKFVAAVGVKNIVVVETRDALLICPRDRAQDVGKIVKWLDEHGERTLV